MNKTYTVGDAIAALDAVFPLSTQDEWDNSGLIVGRATDTLTGILLTVDITLSAVEEAIAKGCNMVVAHHPILFRSLKRLTYSTDEQRLIALALKHDISLFAAHTCADKTLRGTSGTMARMLKLEDISVLMPEEGKLCKICTYAPHADAERVRQAMHDAGAGQTGGNYDRCSFNAEGYGTFRALDGATPHVGQKGITHTEGETKIEMIAPENVVSKITQAIYAAHPYEEPAIDIVPTLNQWAQCGYGAVGTLSEAIDTTAFLERLKKTMSCQAVRYSGWKEKIRRVAICTGSGSEFVGNAMRARADIYITADMKYHQMQQGNEQMMIADIGHYESEALTKQLFLEVLTEKLPTFALCLSETCINPVRYI